MSPPLLLICNLELWFTSHCTHSVSGEKSHFGFCMSQLWFPNNQKSRFAAELCRKLFTSFPLPFGIPHAWEPRISLDRSKPQLHLKVSTCSRLKRRKRRNRKTKNKNGEREENSFAEHFENVGEELKVVKPAPNLPRGYHHSCKFGNILRCHSHPFRQRLRFQMNSRSPQIWTRPGDCWG